LIICRNQVEFYPIAIMSTPFTFTLPEELSAKEPPDMFQRLGIWTTIKRSMPPGSAEMPSARAFTWKLLFDLKRRGIETAHILLYTGLSSYMDDELDAQHPASEEEYFVSEVAGGKVPGMATRDCILRLSRR
jgi:Queuosine biosynthesis protein